MKVAEFKAIALNTEINLNKIGAHFGISKKIKWGDPLFLKSHNLEGILNDIDNKRVYLYHFGAIVFVNINHHEIVDVLNYIKKIETGIIASPPFKYIDDFRLEIDTQTDTKKIEYEYMIIPEIKDYYFEILSTILAKSVALEKIEEGIEVLLDDIEHIVEFLDKGKLNLSDDKLSKIWSKILRFEYNTISYIMLLDKPEVAWNNEEAENTYNELVSFFELEERYVTITQKTETLSHITEAFGGLIHTNRSAKLEWLIIILIAFEILLTLAEKLFNI